MPGGPSTAGALAGRQGIMAGNPVLKQKLSKKKGAICREWLRLIAETYEARDFLTRARDRFANPVGFTISRETEAIVDELCQGNDPERLSSALANIIRIRAVQDLRPSEALSFVFHLKKAARDALAGEPVDEQTFEELRALDHSVDDMALLALDIYSHFRDRIHQLKLNEIKAERERAFVILERSQGIRPNGGRQVSGTG